MRQSLLYFSNFSRHISFKVFQSATFLTLVAIILLCLEFITPFTFSALFNQAYTPQKISNLFFLIVYTILLFLIIPIIISKVIYKEKLNNLGLRAPTHRMLAIFLTIASIAILVPIMIKIARQPSFQSYYSISNPDFKRLSIIQLVIFPIYYYCEEFFFRGFLLLNLWKKVKWHSLWITDILFVFAHISKPLAEIIMALPVGIIFAFLTLITRSIYPSIIVHYAMGVSVILTVNHLL